MASAHNIVQVILTGIAATALMDVWLLVISRLGVPTTDWRLVGRWVGLMTRGHFAHASIAEAMPLQGEHALGWLTHYAVGIGYAVALIAFTGMAWTEQPTVWPALLFGLTTVLFPLLVMQPSMGFGFAGSKTAAPVRSCVRTLTNHAVFGLGLYVAAAALAHL